VAGPGDDKFQANLQVRLAVSQTVSTQAFFGIMLAVFFGASNASFVWATKTLFDRMAPKDPPPQVIVLNDFDWKSFAARLKNPSPPTNYHGI